MKKLVLLLPLLLFLSGCTYGTAAEDAQEADASISQIPPKFDQASGETATTAFVNQQLSSTAQTVNRSMERLAQVEVATHPKVHMPTPMDPLLHASTATMAQTASVDWTGPVQPLLQKVANACHYKLNVLGGTPAIPALVNINAKNQSLSEILRNIGYQIHNVANITVYPKRKIIELRYAST